MTSVEETPGSGLVNVAFKSGQGDSVSPAPDEDESADMFQVDETFSPRYITYTFAE